MRFSRHSKSKARRIKVTVGEVEAALPAGEVMGTDDDGNVRTDVMIRGIKIRVVTAHDDPQFVITLFDRRK